MNILRVAVTIISFIVFVGILIWVWRNRNTSDFKEAANLPFEED
jgi:cytochrome c oxidase cbb3-type subunit 4